MEFQRSHKNKQAAICTSIHPIDSTAIGKRVSGKYARAKLGAY